MLIDNAKLVIDSAATDAKAEFQKEMIVAGENQATEWLEAVADDEYNNLTSTK